MNQLSPLLTAATVLLAVGTGAFSVDASAVDAQREKLANATAICQPALPTFDGLIRKRPLAVQNEGSSAAFVTCSFVSDSGFGGNAGTEGFSLWFTNNSSATVTVSCTGVVGSKTSAGSTFFVKTLSLGAGFTDTIRWTATDNGGANFDPGSPLNTSCQLQPGVGINDTYVWYKVNVGA